VTEDGSSGGAASGGLVGSRDVSVRPPWRSSERSSVPLGEVFR
jgi:hypothetical protein